MADILETIVAHKRQEVAAQEAACPRAELERQIARRPAPLDMRSALAASPTGIIAEFKRRSPSKDWIKRDAKADVIPAAYARAGAAALSILTDERFFGGTLADVRTARPLTSAPILRKDFVVGDYQLLQARAAGADAALLIAACLTKDECRSLKRQAHALGLQVLLEIHGEGELDYVEGDEDMIGVNNRDLGTFHTDVANSFRLAQRLPPDAVCVSESGISAPETIRQLREAGFRGFLVGEAFMRCADPALALASFIQKLETC